MSSDWKKQGEHKKTKGHAARVWDEDGHSMAAAAALITSTEILVVEPAAASSSSSKSR
ncbi:hypothetical protein FIBSPDRAFT_851327 [Athelia psychrophila]|uniref:Uncharacterized protein n=1 Tax=Athelia psychrophila TaxID=1759441 RepID=A0A166SQF3_9AGAM|nr:hypothetical protein FIBSPDRAFT_851327 [Fibularhizoctonia sp. CBS 109695]